MPAYRKTGAQELDVEIIWREGAREVKEAISVPGMAGPPRIFMVDGAVKFVVSFVSGRRIT